MNLLEFSGAGAPPEILRITDITYVQMSIIHLIVVFFTAAADLSLCIIVLIFLCTGAEQVHAVLQQRGGNWYQQRFTFPFRVTATKTTVPTR